MPTDATGAATSPDGLAKYNTANDKPTGNGLNNIVDTIQTAFNTKASKPSGIVSGEVPVWNGTTWVRSSVTNIGAASLGSGTPDATKYLRGDNTWQPTTYVLLYDSVDAGVSLPTATITTTTLSGAYKHLIIEYVGMNSSGSQNLRIRINGDTGGNYYFQNMQQTSTTVTSAATSADTSAFLGVSGTAEPVGGTAKIFNYANNAGSNPKTYMAQSYCQNDGGGVQKAWTVGGMWNNSATITSLSFFHSAGNNVAGTRFSVYGAA